MSTHFLPIFLKNAEYDIQKMRPLIVSGSIDLESILTFCQKFRIAGIADLFLSGTPSTFRANLHKSGTAFLFFLKKAEETDKVTSKAAPFFDAIASGDWDCARGIAQNSRLAWNEEEEYEDDFQYILFLLKHFFLDGTESECDAILEKYKDILDGQPDPCLDVCRAFAGGDADAFDSALGEFLDRYETRFQKRMKAETILPEVGLTEGRLCVEGLALLKLAETKGFALQDEYLFIPSTVRDSTAIAFAADDWKQP